MFGAKTKRLESEISELKEQNKLLETALLREGHQHDFVKTNHTLLNGYHSSLGMSSKYRIDYICATCGKKETDFEVDI